MIEFLKIRNLFLELGIFIFELINPTSGVNQFGFTGVKGMRGTRDL